MTTTNSIVANAMAARKVAMNTQGDTLFDASVNLKEAAKQLGEAKLGARFFFGYQLNDNATPAEKTASKKLNSDAKVLFDKINKVGVEVSGMVKDAERLAATADKFSF